MASKRFETAQTYINAFATLSLPTFTSVLADDLTHTFAPSSMATAFRHSTLNSRAAFLAHIQSLQVAMHGFPVYPKAWVEDPGQNAVWCWADSRTMWKDEAMDGGKEEWVYEGEYVFMLYFDESGEKIVKVVEMLDSWGSKEKMFALWDRAKANLKARNGRDRG